MSIQEHDEMLKRVKAPRGMFRLIGLDYMALPYEADTSLGVFKSVEEAVKAQEIFLDSYDNFLIYDDAPDVITLTESIKKMLNKAGGAQWAREQGLEPATGNWDKPGHWIRPATEDKPEAKFTQHHGQPIPLTWDMGTLETFEDPDFKYQARGKNAKTGKWSYVRRPDLHQAGLDSKFKRAVRFAEAIPKMRKRILKDLMENENAQALYIADRMGFRIGATKSLDIIGDWESFGITLLQRRHVKVQGDRVTFDFVGKKNHHFRKTFKDKKLAQIMLQHRENKKPRDPLFTKTSQGKAARYLKEISGEDFVPHDFRTHFATVIAQKEIVKMKRLPKDEKSMKASKKKIAEIVAKELGNTWSLALSTYILPEVWGPWETAVQKKVGKNG